MANSQAIDLRQLKMGMAVLATCIVRTLRESDPSFEARFLESLEQAYNKFRYLDQETQNVLEALSWTRELLTGWNMSTGQGKPLFD